MLGNALMVALLVTAPGTPRWGHEPYALASPLDVAVSPRDGTIYVADTAGGRVVVLAPDFRATGQVFDAPNVVAVDVSGSGEIASLETLTPGDTAQSLVVRDAQGQVLSRIGPGDDGFGGFTGASGVRYDRAGRLFVFDTDAHRVVVFEGGRFAFEFGGYTWTRKYRSRKTEQNVEERVEDRLYRPVRGDFLPDGRLIVADYDGPVIDPELDRRAGRYGVWKIDCAARTAVFERFLPPDDPYPTSKAGDVCVDPRTGRIYTAEADFPLTDHNFVRVQDGIDEPPRYGTNFFPIRFLTHPRAIALARNGDVIVADADKGVVFPIPRRLFDTPRGAPDPLEWPKTLRIPVCERDRIVLEYTTLEPTLSQVEFAPLVDDAYDYPQPPPAAGRRLVEVPALNERGDERRPGEPDRYHRVELTGLEPGRRYAFRYRAGAQGWPEPLWSETFLATTQPPAGQTQYLEAEVIVLLFTNLADPVRDPQVRPQPAAPGPMTEAEVQGVKERLEWARRFYWINSRGRFNLRFRYVIDDMPYDPAPVANYGYWPDDDHRKIDAILERHGVAHADTAGLCVIYGYRHWDDGAKRWVLSGSGGNTWGSIHDGSAILAFSAGGDTCWLFVHEYGHAMGINYQYSGHVFHFNHFHWNYLPTDYGAHYDGMAAMCREFSDVAYWANRYGRLVQAADADEDGLPDDDPRCPLDEKRFGSAPDAVDTDGDGLTDREELMATQGLASYAQAFDLRPVAPVFEPDPRDVDTDGDGILDGDDPYPLYPWDTTVRFAPITVDGEIFDDEWPAEGFHRVMTDPALQGDVRLAWDFGHLYVGLVQQVRPGEERPARIYMELDANNDGMTVGADNLELTFEPQPEGVVHVRTRYNDTIIRQKPLWRDNVLPSPRDVRARWSRQDDEYHLEIALPQTKDAGLDCVRFEQLGVMFQLRPDGGRQEYRLFEPQQHFDVRLR